MAISGVKKVNMVAKTAPFDEEPKQKTEARKAEEKAAKDTIAAATEKLYLVKDESCSAANPKRIHDIMVNGELKPIVFEYGKDVKLPLALAAKFNIPGFHVYDRDEEIERPVETPQNVAVTLDADKVVASYEELTTVALYLRAAIISGGEKFTKDSKRSDLIAFLIESRKTPEQKADQSQKTETILEDEEIDDDKLKEMLPDDEG